MSFFKKKSDKEDRDSEWKPVIIEREGRFHMLCYRYTVERLLPKVRNLFRGDNLSRFVNSYLRKMEPMLVHHMNLEPMQWEFSLKWGNEPKEFEYIYDDEGRCVGKIAETMTEHLYVKLDYRNYKLLKKFHEACNTYSMAKILRAVLTFCLDGIERLGAGVFWRKVREWVKKNCKEFADKIIPLPNYIAAHMLRSKDAPPEMISEYAGDYIHKEIKYYHPPPGQPKK